MNGFSGAEDDYDRQGEVLVIKFGDKVIGGARIVTSTIDLRTALPLEDDSFVLAKALPEHHLQWEQYCEFSRMALLPEHRSLEILSGMVANLIAQAINMGSRYLFTISPMVQARCYRKIVHNLGMEYKILEHVQLPVQQVYKHLKDVKLAMIDFQNASHAAH